VGRLGSRSLRERLASLPLICGPGFAIRVAVPLQVYVCIYIVVLYVLEKSEDAQIRCLLLLYSCLAWLTLSAVHAYAYVERVVSWAHVYMQPCALASHNVHASC